MKSFIPLTSSLRHTLLLNKSFYDFTNIKFICKGYHPSVGRNNSGHITMRHRQRGTKKNYKMIDYSRRLYNIKGEVITLEFDSYRSSYIGLIYWKNGVFSYIITPTGLHKKDIIWNYINCFSSLNKLFYVNNYDEIITENYQTPEQIITIRNKNITVLNNNIQLLKNEEERVRAEIEKEKHLSNNRDQYFDNEKDKKQQLQLNFNSEEIEDLRDFISTDDTHTNLLNTYNNLMERNKLGNTNLLKDLVLGTRVCNIENKPFTYGVYCRAPGAFSILTRQRFHKGFIRLFSSRRKILSDLCRATIGKISNKNHHYINYGKAGRMRWLGVRPSVRGVAMNPVDHPHGGGEGKKTKKAYPRTPWGRIKKKKKNR